MQRSVNEFLNPRNIEVQEVSTTNAKVTLEPLERGLVILWVVPSVESYFRQCQVVQ